MTVNSATKATVTYDITLSGATALANQTGTAVYQDGMWKVGDVSFCQLLKLETRRHRAVRVHRPARAADGQQAEAVSGDRPRAAGRGAARG